MAPKSSAQLITEAKKCFSQGLLLLRAAEQKAWEEENKLQASLEYSRELEQKADPMNDGHPIIDSLFEKNHAA